MILWKLKKIQILKYDYQKPVEWKNDINFKSFILKFVKSNNLEACDLKILMLNLIDLGNYTKNNINIYEFNLFKIIKII